MLFKSLICFRGFDRGWRHLAISVAAYLSLMLLWLLFGNGYFIWAPVYCWWWPCKRRPSAGYVMPADRYPWPSRRFSLAVSVNGIIQHRWKQWHLS
ncbi:MAG: hypothetical protein LRY40_04200 [Shewanella fodinae]|nr:hypothetical protein [Shewanella fodinae]